MIKQKENYYSRKKTSMNSTLNGSHIAIKRSKLIAVIVNEFGEIGIDNQLVINSDEEILEMNNGCICCTINDSLVDAVYNILERSDRIDYMILETTGVADPLPIALTFLGTELKHLTRLDSILTVVDAELFNEDHFDSEAAFQQIAYGDIIILNKTDLVDKPKLQELEKFINTVKPKARILRSQYGKVPLPLILDVNVDQSELLAKSADESNHAHDHDHEHHHHHYHSDHLANDGFISVSFQSDRPFDLDKFQIFLDKRLPVDVFRAKGLLHFAGIEPRYIFQLSGKRYELKTDDRDLAKINQLVLIGRNLNGTELQTQLANCLA